MKMTSIFRPFWIVALAAFLALQAFNFYQGYADTLERPPPSPPPLADIIRQSTSQDGIVLYYGWDWNTLIPYYAVSNPAFAALGQRTAEQVICDLRAA